MEKIEAEHEYIKDLFDDENLFEIPSYQRPFSWEKENFEQLIDDIKESISLNLENDNKFNKYEPYFLGSIIRLKSEQDDGHYKYSIIDGQQRLMSLVILIAVIRDLINEEQLQKELQGFIYQEPKEIIDRPEQSRIVVRNKERQFFKELILQNEGTLKRNDIDKNDFVKLSEPKQRIIMAIDVFKSKLVNGENQDLLKNFVKYLLKKVILVVITTSSFESAFRLFNVVNARGMPLTNADLLKSVNLGNVYENDIGKYTDVWENIEEDIGIEKLEMLISFIRTIKIKKRARKTIFDEFEGIIFYEEPEFKGKLFIEYLDNVKSIYQLKILESAIICSEIENEVHYHNLMSIMRDFLPLNDWMAALIMFDEKFKNDEYIYKFLKNLERKIFVDWLTGLTLAERLTQIYRVIKLIEDKEDPESIINDVMFYEEIKSTKNKFKDSLELENFYSKGNYKIAKYVLLRIDMERNENLHKKVSFSGNISVEHVLPQRPNKYWKRKFTEQAIQEWTNKLGNLTLLNGIKNSKAGNKRFKEKINTYFQKKSDFSITNELQEVSDWNKIELEKRHRKLKSEAVNIWINSL